jgi:hypothetical protein
MSMFYESSVVVNVSHTWETKGNYVIKIRAEDENRGRSNTVNWPFLINRNKNLFLNFFELLFKRFPKAFTILIYLIEIY